MVDGRMKGGSWGLVALWRDPYDDDFSQISRYGVFT